MLEVKYRLYFIKDNENTQKIVPRIRLVPMPERRNDRKLSEVLPGVRS